MASDDDLLRSMIARERERHQRAEAKPWESGVVDWNKVNLTPEEQMRRRMDALDKRFAMLCQLLEERGVIEPGALDARLAAAEAERARVKAAAEAAEDAAVRVADERTVECADCSAAVRARDSYLSSRGALCSRCHTLREE